MAARLRGGAEQGWEVLAEEYPSIIRYAIDRAMGRNDNKPSDALLKALIELLPKIVGNDIESEDTIIGKLLGEIRFVRPETESDGGPTLDRDSDESRESGDGGYPDGANTDSEVY